MARSINKQVREGIDRGVRVSLDWDTASSEVMEKVLRLKVAQHGDVEDALLGTEHATIIEASPFDSRWGEGADRKGKNELGKLWEKIRNEKQSP